jgi:hypothetical protein
MPSRSLVAATLLATLLAAAPRSARGLDVHKKYEQELVRWALGKAGLERDPSPAGKIIERVEIVRENIIARSDPWPNFLNYFHMTTRDFIVRQELLIAPGEVWDEARIEESARNLRKLTVIAVVQTIPCRSRKPGHVVLLVVTKDLWSIRLNMIFSMVGTTVQSLELYPTEGNLLGRNKRLSLHVAFRQLDLDRIAIRDRWALGELYLDPRLLGSRWSLQQQFDARVAGAIPCGGAIGADSHAWCPSAAKGAFEGAYGLLWLRRPLYSLATEWAFEAYVMVDVQQARRYATGSAGPELKLIRLQQGAQQQLVPWVYDRQDVVGLANFTRSFGHDFKHDVTAGFSAYRYHRRPPDNLGLEGVARDRFISGFVPRSEEAAYVYAAYHAHDTRFIQLHNVQTFALTEDYQLGPDFSLEGRAAVNFAEPSQSYAEVVMESLYRWYIRDDLFAIWINGRTRLQPNLYAIGYHTPWANAQLEFGIKNITRRLWIGRLHAQLYGIFRHNNLDRVTSTLGGDSGLRGYPSAQFEGNNLVRVNVEYRSRPINLFTLHVGFALFYDGGGVFGGPDPQRPDTELAFRYYQTLGVGLRGHFPQFDKESLRLDFGVPLSGDRGPFSTWFSVAFGQLF